MGRHHYSSSNLRATVHHDQSTRRVSYNQHDDRIAPPSSSRGRGGRGNRVWTRDGRHVSFNDRGGGGRIRKRGAGGARGGLRTYISSEEPRQAGLSRPVAGSLRSKYGRSSRGGRGGYIQHSLDGGGWHKVVLANASRHPKEEVLAALVAAHPSVAPLGFSKHGMNFVFHVETRQQAAALSGLDKAVRLADGSALSIRSEPSPPPHMNIDDEAVEKIKSVMSGRYGAENKALDLKAFHADRAFLGEAVYAPLYRGACMKRVLQIVEQNIAEVEAVDISENRLPNLETFSSLTAKARNVRILYMAKNKISDIKELVRLRDWKLVELNVDGNPLVDKYQDYSHFVSSVRKIFPTLKRLDGKDLPKVIGFEGDDDHDYRSGSGSLPEPVAKMNCNPASEGIILQFMQEYFKVYDSASREMLMTAYHEEAMMSMACEYTRGGSRLVGAERLNEYTSRARNLFRIVDPTKRKATLRQGRLAVVSFLNELPRSTHDLNSFTLDVTLATETVMAFTITGVFREEGHPDGAEPVLRHFNRTFLVVPQNAGFCIANEVLFVTSATKAQARTAFASAAAPTGTAVSAETVRKIVEAVAAKTGMNEEWSRKCLEETQWDADKACQAFQVARDAGKIPIEAYEK